MMTENLWLERKMFLANKVEGSSFQNDPIMLPAGQPTPGIR